MLDDVQKSFCEISLRNKVWTVEELMKIFNATYEEIEETINFKVESMDYKKEARFIERADGSTSE